MLVNASFFADGARSPKLRCERYNIEEQRLCNSLQKLRLRPDFPSDISATDSVPPTHTAVNDEVTACLKHAKAAKALDKPPVTPGRCFGLLRLLRFPRQQ
jgi:hypothetical protein